MKIITYFAFTLLSIVIQFVFMDLIREKVEIDDDKLRNIVDLNATSPKKRFSEILQQYTVNNKHALYYRGAASYTDKGSSAKIFTNASIIESAYTTEMSSTIFDLMYDDNTTTITEDSFTTESLYSSTPEYENITDISIFGKKKNTTEVIPKTPPKKLNKDCSCNMLYNVCDINCCCDGDCTDAERKMFLCTEHLVNKEESYCHSQLIYNTYLMGSNVDSLLCIVKNNLPEKRKIYQNTKHDPDATARSFKWHTSRKMSDVHEFKKEPYKYGDPIWLLRNNVIYFMDLPSTVVNNYCNDRRPVMFLKDESITCNVNLSDLETFQILSVSEETFIVSVTEESANTSSLNCSTLHCTEWNIILCNEANCSTFNKSLHAPLCTENVCTNLALRVDYIFHYYENKIMNATIKFYTVNVPLTTHFTEEVNVRFIVANKSIDNIIGFSGNPGYISGRPLIASYVQSNYTDDFFNNTDKRKRYLLHPENRKGQCVRSNIANNFDLFGINKRIKCRYYHVLRAPYRNASDICKNIQKNVTNMLGFGNRTAVSPLGNPHGLKDEDWLQMTVDTSEPLYGEINKQNTKITCYNLVNRFSLVFTYADVSDQIDRSLNKLLSAKVGVSPINVTFDIEEVTTVVTIDAIFLDETKPTVYEYAGAPHLNIHLPRDFFFPFPSNYAHTFTISMNLIVSICIVNFMK